MKYIMLPVLLFLVIISSCTKDDNHYTHGNLLIEMQYVVDNDNLVMDDKKYVNEAGNEYNVNRLEYFLSDFKILAPNSSFNDEYAYYLNPKSHHSFVIKNIPVGIYRGMKFHFGVSPALNISNGLPNITEYNNMAWPEMMGGGYHHMRLEGFFDDNGSNTGYTIHTGLNDFSIPYEFLEEITIPAGGTTKITLVMNVNEWFRNPYTYDLTVDPNYTMGNADAMGKIADNGKDVITLKSIE